MYQSSPESFLDSFLDGMSSKLFTMHIVSNIRNIKKFHENFPSLADPEFSGEEFAKKYAASDVRARCHDLVVAKVIRAGATNTEDSDGTQRKLVVGEWMIAPVVERESSLSHGSVIPKDGIPIGATIDYICRGGGVGVSPDNPPAQGDPTKVEIMGILRYQDGRIVNAHDFALELRPSKALKPVIAIVGSKSDCGKTTACADLIELLHRNNYRIGVAKLAGTARRGELLELSHHANQWLDQADAGLPTTYCPSLASEEELSLIRHRIVAGSQSIIEDLSIENDIIVAEFGGDLLAGCVPEILAEPDLHNIVALVMAVESATAAIGMETKLHRISSMYKDMPWYVVGPVANLQANQNRVRRETNCAGCYDLWSRNKASASQKQIDNSDADTQELTRRLVGHCGYEGTPLASKI